MHPSLSLIFISLKAKKNKLFLCKQLDKLTFSVLIINSCLNDSSAAKEYEKFLKKVPSANKKYLLQYDKIQRNYICLFPS